MATNPARILVEDDGRTVDVGGLHHAPVTAEAVVPERTLMVSAAHCGQDLLVRHSGGGWVVHPDVFWSLLAPLNPIRDETKDEIVAAVWQRLRWWQALPTAEVLACAGLLDQHVRGASDALAILGHVAGAGDPRGSAETVAAEPRPSVAWEHLTDPMTIAAFVRDPDGLGRCYGREFLPRDEQAELAASVARSLDGGHALLAEAGTGTGKTLAYLVPLVARLIQHGGRAVVSTYSRALQVQLLTGDLPRLVADESDLRFRLLMGRGNYLCLRQRLAYLTRPRENVRDAFKAVALRLWLQATFDGMREELVGHPLLGEDLPVLFSDIQPCTPQCQEGGGCFVTRARRLARKARLVVVNHALLLHDRGSCGAILGPFDQLVVDEAHRLPAVALETRTVRLHRGRLLDLEAVVGAARTEGMPLEVPSLLANRLAAFPDAEKMVTSATFFGTTAARALRQYAEWWRAAGRELATAAPEASGPRIRLPDKDIAFAPIRDETRNLIVAVAEASAACAQLNQRTESIEEPGDAVLDLLLRCAQAGQLFNQLERDLRFVTSDPTDRWVTWLERSPRDAVAALGATPLESGGLLREVWQEAALAPVATSATLAVGEDFGFMLGELGLGGRRPATECRAVASPFDWDTQTRCLAPERMIGPNQPGFAETIAEVLLELRREVPRQTLVLFTSYKLLDDVAGRLVNAERGRASGTLLVQTPRTGADAIRETFRASRGAMLLGTSTFWEGVDFPGKSLEIVVVTKLPFQVPSDPWVETRCEHMRAAGEDPFKDFMVRDAVLRMRQGVGRLLRRRSDRGVVLLLDNRLISRGYGTTFRTALPTTVQWVPDHRDLAAGARAFLEQT